MIVDRGKSGEEEKQIFWSKATPIREDTRAPPYADSHNGLYVQPTEVSIESWLIESWRNYDLGCVRRCLSIRSLRLLDAEWTLQII